MRCNHYIVPDPLKCIAFGPGLERAEVGYDAEFTVQLRNASGKNITSGGEVIDVQIKVCMFDINAIIHYCRLL